MNETVKLLSQNMNIISGITFIKSNYVKFMGEFSEAESIISIEYTVAANGAMLSHTFNVLHNDGIKEIGSNDTKYLSDEDYNQCLSIVEDCLKMSIEQFTGGTFFYLQTDGSLISNNIIQPGLTLKNIPHGLYKRKVRFA